MPAAPLQDLPLLTRLTHLSLSLCNLAAGAGCGPGSPLLALQQTLAALPLLASLALGVDGVTTSSNNRALPLHGLPGLTRLALLCDPAWRCALEAVPTLEGTMGLLVSAASAGLRLRCCPVYCLKQPIWPWAWLVLGSRQPSLPH